MDSWEFVFFFQVLYGKLGVILYLACGSKHQMLNGTGIFIYLHENAQNYPVL